LAVAVGVGVVCRVKALALVVLVAVVAGCGSEEPNEPNDSGESDGSAASSTLPPERVVDPCTVLTDEQLRELGVRPESRREVSELDARGCGWLGDPFGFTLTTNPDTVAEYRNRRNSPIFKSFRDNEVTGRPGVQFSTISDQCAQVLTAGSGGLVVNVSDSSGVSDPVDECAQALRIMTMIEPKLPETRN
jgi:hypothetical protein